MSLHPRNPVLHTAFSSQFTHHRDEAMWDCSPAPLSPHLALGDSSAVSCSCSCGTEAGGDMAVETGPWGCCRQGLSRN